MNLTTLPPWSFSMIEMFENCPRKAFHKYLLKEKEPESAAMAEGNRLDRAIEARILKDAALPAEFQKYDPMALSIIKQRSAATKVMCQVKLGIDRGFKPVKFFDRAVWGRGALDVLLYKYPNAIIADWKTGKNSENKPYSNKGLQLKIFALLVFKHFPKIEKVTAFNIWLKSNEFGKVHVWTRADEAVLWREVLPRVIAIEKACAQAKWPTTPGPLCGYCPVKACEFNRG